MSSDDAADDDRDPWHVRFIRMPASETFDGQERVMSRAAYDLQVQATAHSASCGHPGSFLTTILSIWTASASRPQSLRRTVHLRMWERIDGGYRVLDWEAVEVCLDQVRQRRGEDSQALAWEREHEAKIQAQMA